MGCTPTKNAADSFKIFEEILTYCNEIAVQLIAFKTLFDFKKDNIFSTSHIAVIASVKESLSRMLISFNNLESISKDIKFMSESATRITIIISKISELIDICSGICDCIRRIIKFNLNLEEPAQSFLDKYKQTLLGNTGLSNQYITANFNKVNNNHKQSISNALTENFGTITSNVGASCNGINKSISACTLLATKNKIDCSNNVSELMNGVEDVHAAMQALYKCLNKVIC